MHVWHRERRPPQFPRGATRLSKRLSTEQTENSVGHFTRPTRDGHDGWRHEPLVQPRKWRRHDSQAALESLKDRIWSTPRITGKRVYEDICARQQHIGDESARASMI